MICSCDCWQHSLLDAATVRAFVPCWLFSKDYLLLVIGFLCMAAPSVASFFFKASKETNLRVLAIRVVGPYVMSSPTHNHACAVTFVVFHQLEFMDPDCIQKEGFTQGHQYLEAGILGATIESACLMMLTLFLLFNNVNHI